MGPCTANVSKCFSTAPHIRSYRAPCSCFPKKVSVQLSSEQSVDDVGITQLDWKRVPQARSGGCRRSFAIAAECWRQHASRNVSWAQRASSAVGHETPVVGQSSSHVARDFPWRCGNFTLRTAIPVYTLLYLTTVFTGYCLSKIFFTGSR